MTARYFLGSQLLGSSGHVVKWDDSQLTTASLALACPTCGEVWGRVLDNFPGWQFVVRPCHKHPRTDADDSAGSFIAPWRSTFQELPPEVLEYELQLRLDRYKESP